MNCPNCNNIIPDDSIFCPECGLQQRDIAPTPTAPDFDKAVSEPEELVFNETAPTSEGARLGGIPKEVPVFGAPAAEPETTSPSGAAFAATAAPAPERAPYGASFAPNAAPADTPSGAPVNTPAFTPCATPVPTVKKEADASKDGFAVSSLVIGIISLIPFGGSIAFAIASLVFGIIGTKSTKKGVSIAGIVLSAIAILFTILTAVLFVFVLITAITETYGAFDEFVREFENSVEYGYYY